MSSAPRTAAVLPCLLVGWLSTGCAPGAGSNEATDPVERETVAESSGFERTSRLEEALTFLEALDEASDAVELTTFGVSAEGREMPLVVVSGSGAFTPTKAREGGRPVVLIQSGIHAGEIDGKDASLILLREIVTGERRELLDAGTLLIVPVYNVDGHERVSPYSRANQNGPVAGMGWRTTASGLDLNRDHLKIVSPEARALMELVNRWRPHLHVDNHVTNGSDHDWTLTYSHAEAPQLTEPVDRWLRKAVAAAAGETESAGYGTGPYVSLIDWLDPSRGFDSWVGLPRYSSGYFPLRNRPSILVEMHAHKSYEPRVRANHAFLVGLLEELTRSGAELVEAVGAAEAATVAAGRADAPPSSTVLRWESHDSGETIRWPVYSWSLVESPFSGPHVRYESGRVADDEGTEVPWVHRARPSATLARPRGYVVLPGWPQIEARLIGHGLTAMRVERELSAEVETIRVADSRPARASYQGLTRLEASVVRETEQRTIPAGAIWVPADQPDFEIAVQLLEPDASDSLFGWGLVSSVTERKEFMSRDVLDRLARNAMEDPGTARAWREALEDPAFAADPGARFMWWYRRTPYWDETVGMLPVYRAMEPLPLELGERLPANAAS